MKEEDKEKESHLTDMGYVKTAMQALEILEKTVREMGGYISSKIATKPSKYETKEGGRAITVSLKLIFIPSRLREYIAQHPVPEECNE
jgi:hypothetical protein